MQERDHTNNGDQSKLRKQEKKKSDFSKFFLLNGILLNGIVEIHTLLRVRGNKAEI